MPDIFDVIADGTRREILQFLLRREADDHDGTSVSDIVTELGVSQPTISKHLKVLRESELVSVREDGQHRLYSIAPEPLRRVEDWVMPFLDGDDYDFEELLGAGLPEPAVRVAESVGRAAASAKNAVQSALRRFGN